MNWKQLFIATSLLASACSLALAAQQTSAPKPAAKPATARQAEDKDEGQEGARIFERRCSSCHNAPEGFSPRISGTVVRHMRVRASLSQREEEELLRFFNP